MLFDNPDHEPFTLERAKLLPPKVVTMTTPTSKTQGQLFPTGSGDLPGQRLLFDPIAIIYPSDRAELK
jgi:hypothetical protein